LVKKGDYMKKNNEEFTLYDLRVEVVKGKKKFVCNHKVGRIYLSLLVKPSLFML